MAFDIMAFEIMGLLTLVPYERLSISIEISLDRVLASQRLLLYAILIGEKKGNYHN